jgi:hypothetical protein
MTVATLACLFHFVGTACASEHQPTSYAVSTTLGGFPGNKLIDNNSATAWSSSLHNSANNDDEWFKVYWSNQPTNYIRLVPRVVSGTAVGVPGSVKVYYAIGSVWILVKTVNLPLLMPAGGYRIYFPPVTTTGIRVTAQSLRTVGPNQYAFQMAEVYGGYEDRFSAWTGNPNYGVHHLGTPITSYFLNPGASRQHVAAYAYVPTKPANIGVYASSSLTGWESSQAIDGNSTTAWSSERCYTTITEDGETYCHQDHYEEFAFWFDATTINYVQLIPRTGGEVTYAVPHDIWIYYSANGQWNYSTTVTLNKAKPGLVGEGIASIGYEIALPREVTADGILIVANRLRPDENGEIYFQLVDASAGYATLDYNPAGMQGLAQSQPGTLFFLIDEPDQHALSPDTYAKLYHDFVSAVRDPVYGDPGARVSPAPFALPNSVVGIHHTDYAQAFVDRYVERYGTQPPVDEWRWDILFGDCNDAWVNMVETAATFSLIHGAQAAIAIGGYADTQKMSCQISYLKNHGTVSAIMWSMYEATLYDETTSSRTAPGEVFCNNLDFLTCQ